MAVERLINIGSVIIHAANINPYVYSKNGGCVGAARVKVLRDFRDTGKLPDGIVLWDDGDRKAITKPEEIDWSGLRK